MKSIYYIMLILGVATFALAGCGATPIKKTNCWSAAGTPVATSTQSAAPVLSTSSEAARIALMVERVKAARVKVGQARRALWLQAYAQDATFIKVKAGQ